MPPQGQLVRPLLTSWQGAASHDVHGGRSPGAQLNAEWKHVDKPVRALRGAAEEAVALGVCA